MNELRPYSNKSNSENKMGKKILKELKVIIYMVRYILLFGGSIIKTPNLSMFLFGVILIWVSF